MLLVSVWPFIRKIEKSIVRIEEIHAYILYFYFNIYIIILYISIHINFYQYIFFIVIYQKEKLKQTFSFYK